MTTYKILQLSDGSNEPRVIMTNISDQEAGHRVVNMLNNDAAEAYGVHFILETETPAPAKLPYETPVLAVVAVTCPLCNGIANKLNFAGFAECVECKHRFEDTRL